MKKDCFECGSVEYVDAHHILPRSLGGIKTVYLCAKCHSLAHGNEALRNSDHSNLVKQGIQKRKDSGRKVGRPTESDFSMDRFIVIRVSDDEKKEIFDFAKANGVSVSKLVRIMIRDYPNSASAASKTSSPNDFK